MFVAVLVTENDAYPKKGGQIPRGKQLSKKWIWKQKSEWCGA